LEWILLGPLLLVSLELVVENFELMWRAAALQCRSHSGTLQPLPGQKELLRMVLLAELSFQLEQQKGPPWQWALLLGRE
jgi:hypothetical protein